MELIQPSSIDIATYEPTHTAPTSCSTLLTNVEQKNEPPATVELATVLPPKPDANLCNCMMESLECTANLESFRKPETIDSKSTKIQITDSKEREIVERVCPESDSSCLGTKRNTTIGQYGTFSVCNASQRASWILNQFYKSRGDPETCASVGGIIRKSMLSTSQPSHCKDLLRQAGPKGTGIIKYSPPPGELQNDLFPSKQRAGSLSTARGKIGLGLGMVFLVLSLIVVSIYWFRMRWKTSPSITTDAFRKAELADDPVLVRDGGMVEICGREVEEIDSIPRSEVGVDGGLIELPTVHNEPTELEAPVDKTAAATGGHYTSKHSQSIL